MQSNSKELSFCIVVLLPPHAFSALNFHQSQQNFWHLELLLLDFNTTEMELKLLVSQHSEVVNGLYSRLDVKRPGRIRIEVQFIKILIQDDNK